MGFCLSPNWLQLTHQLDLKEIKDDGEFEGYGAVFGNVDQHDDIIEKGAFRRTLSEKPLSAIKMLFQHDSHQPIGIWTDMKEDERGLYVKGKLLIKVQRAAEVLELMRNKVIDGLSIGYKTIKSMRDESTGIRKLLDVDLWEVSAVTFPANPQARVDAVKDSPPKTPPTPQGSAQTSSPARRVAPTIAPRADL
jgi:HK97 family phage prohead protease